MSNVFDSLITAGNSFQIVGAEKLKERLLKLVVQKGIDRRFSLAERRQRDGWYMWRRFLRYGGWLVDKLLYVRKAILYWIRLCTGSQWTDIVSGHCSLRYLYRFHNLHQEVMRFVSSSLVVVFARLFVGSFVRWHFGAGYLQNGWRQRLGSSGPPIGNGKMAHRMVAGSMFGAHYLENSWMYRFGYNRTPVGNGT